MKQSIFLKVLFVTAGLFLMFGCSNINLIDDENENVSEDKYAQIDDYRLLDGIVLDMHGEKVKIGALTDEDIENGIRNSVSANFIYDRIICPNKELKEYYNSVKNRSNTRWLNLTPEQIAAMLQAMMQAIINDVKENSVKQFYAAGPKNIIIGMRDGAGCSELILKSWNKAKEAHLDYEPSKPMFWMFKRDHYYHLVFLHGETSPEPIDLEEGIYNRLEIVKEYSGLKNTNQYCLLLIGKSVGAAAIYRSLYRIYYGKSKYFGGTQFYKVGVVLVDAHEPFAPGDEGNSGQWYDYVHFNKELKADGDYYNLTLWQKWADNIIYPNGDDRQKFTQLRIWNTYQRGSGLFDGFEGYSFTGQYYFNNKLNNCVKNVRQYGVEHTEIEGTNKTVEIMVEPLFYFLCARN
ncbi:MAG: hypothetical protein JW881_13360 [Spirochaetales bacterium]|nr:hypothetical protein [Spirochaetales bacterium]